MKRVLLVTTNSELPIHRYFENALDKALVQSTTRAGTVTNSEGIRNSIESGHIDLLHFTSPIAARLIPVGCSLPTIVSVQEWPIDGNLRRILDDLALADLVSCGTPIIANELRKKIKGPEFSIHRQGIDNDLFNPNSNLYSRDYLIDFDDEKKMMVAIGTMGIPEILTESIESLPSEISNNLNFIRLDDSRLLPEQKMAILQHAEIMLFADASRFHRQVVLHACASGCPVRVINPEPALDVLDAEYILSAEDPREWADAITKAHEKWRRAGGVPRHPDELLIERMEKHMGPNQCGINIDNQYTEAQIAHKMKTEN